MAGLFLSGTNDYGRRRFPWQAHRQRVRDDLKAKKPQGMEYVKKFSSWHSLLGVTVTLDTYLHMPGAPSSSISIQLNESQPA